MGFSENPSMSNSSESQTKCRMPSASQKRMASFSSRSGNEQERAVDGDRPAAQRVVGGFQ